MRIAAVADLRQPRFDLSPPASADQVVHIAEQSAFARVVPVDSAKPKPPLVITSQGTVIVGRQPIDAAPEHTEHIEDVPEQLALGPGYLRPHINEDLTVLSGVPLAKHRGHRAVVLRLMLVISLEQSQYLVLLRQRVPLRAGERMRYIVAHRDIPAQQSVDLPSERIAEGYSARARDLQLVPRVVIESDGYSRHGAVALCHRCSRWSMTGMLYLVQMVIARSSKAMRSRCRLGVAVATA